MRFFEVLNLIFVSGELQLALYGNSGLLTIHGKLTFVLVVQGEPKVTQPLFYLVISEYVLILRGLANTLKMYKVRD